MSVCTQSFKSSSKESKSMTCKSDDIQVVSSMFSSSMMFTLFTKSCGLTAETGPGSGLGLGSFSTRMPAIKWESLTERISSITWSASGPGIWVPSIGLSVRETVGGCAKAVVCHMLRSNDWFLANMPRK